MCLFFLAGQWDFKAPGLTAIGHPAPLSLAETHGVFVLEDMKSPWEKYQQGKTAISNIALKWMDYFVADSLQPSMMANAKCFLHKQTVKKLKERGAVIPEVDLVLTCTLLYVSNVVLHARKQVFQPPMTQTGVLQLGKESTAVHGVSSGEEMDNQYLKNCKG